MYIIVLNTYIRRSGSLKNVQTRMDFCKKNFEDIYGRTSLIMNAEAYIRPLQQRPFGNLGIGISASAFEYKHSFLHSINSL